MAAAGEESDAPSVVSEPPDWNSDDEPPEDHVGDTAICSRDGMVTKRIERVGKDFGRPGQYDRVHARYRVLQGADRDAAAEAEGAEGAHGSEESAAFEEVMVSMGEDRLPLAVEFALKCMRLGEVAEVEGPAAYAAKLSPLCGQRLRRGSGHLPSLGKVARKLRFLPAAPRELEAQARRGAAAFRARVELLAIHAVQMLTEDRRVSKQVLRPGRGRRTPRLGDLVRFSSAPSADEGRATWRTAVLGDAGPPLEAMERVLLSMKEGERCLAWLPGDDAGPPLVAASGGAGRPSASSESAAVPRADPSRAPAEASAATEQEQEQEPAHAAGHGSAPLVLTMHCWHCRDTVPMSPPGAENASTGSVDFPALRKFELRKGPERLDHDVEHGSMVLVGLARSAQPGSQSVEAPTTGQISLLAWCLGEGSVPGYIEASLGGMRLAESAVFYAPSEAITCVRPGPSYKGKTPLRRLELPELRDVVNDLFDDGEAGAIRDPACDLRSESATRVACVPPSNWTLSGDALPWEELEFEQPAEDPGGMSFKLTLLAATEAPDICMMTDEGQREYLEKERAHGNALAKLGRYAEASLAYSKALDGVRRSPLYKALFPTERGRIDGAYSRDPGEHECPLEKLPQSDVDSWRASLVALHLNLALCAGREGRQAEARKHCSAALGAEPANAKALFRRGSAAASQGDYEEALRDLQRAQELEPQDRAVREELQALHRRMRRHREAERGMFRGAFGPPGRAAEAPPAPPAAPPPAGS